MATETAVALDSNLKLLLMSRILVAVEKMVPSCYNRDQTWLCVYCREFDANNTHNHVWSLKLTIIGSDNGLSPGRHTKPLPETMLEYRWLDHWEQTSVNSQSKFIHFHSWKCIWKRRLENGGHLFRPQSVHMSVIHASVSSRWLDCWLACSWCHNLRQWNYSPTVRWCTHR